MLVPLMPLENIKVNQEMIVLAFLTFTVVVHIIAPQSPYIPYSSVIVFLFLQALDLQHEFSINQTY